MIVILSSSATLRRGRAALAARELCALSHGQAPWLRFREVRNFDFQGFDQTAVAAKLVERFESVHSSRVLRLHKQLH